MTRLGVLVFVLGACGACSDHAAKPPGDAAGDVSSGGDAMPAGKRIAYVSGYGPDIAWFTIAHDTGALVAGGKLAAFAAGPSFLAVAPDASHLYAVSESTSRVGAYAIDRATGALTFINDVSSGGSGPAHVSVDRSGRWVLVANYTDGAIAVLPIRGDGGLGAPHQTLNAGANAHMIVTDASNHFVLVPCKGADYVAQYTFDATSGMLAPNATPHFATAAGAGPRHLAFAPDGTHAYLINENASTMMALAFDTASGRLSELQTISTLAPGTTVANTGAEVWVHPTAARVYGSNRGDDSIAVFKIDGAGKLAFDTAVKTLGKTPRDFTLDPDGHFLYVTNQGSNSVVDMAIDATGRPAPTSGTTTAPSPSFVGIVTLPP